MAQLTISEVASQVELQPSAIRYYEQIGLVPRAERMSGQRRYDTTAVYRLAVIQRARQLGFTLAEVRELFFGFDAKEVPNRPRASERWRALSTRKLGELDTLMKEIRTMRRLLRKMMDRCHCDTLDQCGKGIFRGGVVRVKMRQVKLRPSQ
jgi:MerR family redox-sensitive transcriptional activator SoxR